MCVGQCGDIHSLMRLFLYFLTWHPPPFLGNYNNERFGGVGVRIRLIMSNVMRIMMK